MRYFLIIKEALGKGRTIEILDSTTDKEDAVEKLIMHSNQWEVSIVAGDCKIYMTTYIESEKDYR